MPYTVRIPVWLLSGAICVSLSKGDQQLVAYMDISDAKLGYVFT